jgi:N-methylhydantoinase B
VQPLGGQERCIVVTTCHEILPGSGGPGRHRGGCGVRKGGVLTDVDATVMSYCCDRGRSVTWGINGGLPSVPHGVWLQPAGNEETFLGAVFSNVEVHPRDRFWRPSGQAALAREETLQHG